MKETGTSDTQRHARGAPPNLVIEDVAITKPGKILYEKSDITKADVAKYYAEVAQRMMPYIQNRIISIVRCPGGIDGGCFFKKHPAGDSGIVTVAVDSNNGGQEEYFYIADVRGLIAEVQMYTLEFHTWGSKVDSLEKPDVMVFDLDPDKGMDLARVRQGVLDLKRLLDKHALTSYLKTSGGKGYHIVVPFAQEADWGAFHGFAKSIAQTMETTWPDRYTSNSRKGRRDGKIFIDWLRNTRGATSVAPYSIRAREGAPVSMPIFWDALATVPPQGVDIAGAIARLRDHDPWEGFFENPQSFPGYGVLT